MKSIFGYIGAYLRFVNKTYLAVILLFTAFLIWLNYSMGFEQWLVYSSGLPWSQFSGHVALFVIAFWLPFLLHGWITRSDLSRLLPVLMIIISAPLIFSFKMSMDSNFFHLQSADWNDYWNQVIYWPARGLIVTLILFIAWRIYQPRESFFGLTFKGFDRKPYLLMLLIMVPLILAASTQPDFLHAYPKLQRILPLPADAEPGWLYMLLFELSYGSDFFIIELFFRGFLIVGLMKWLGRDAILPVAVFYCTIHFGKPLAECISSFFGGMLLGILAYHTRTIIGGLMVHLGIAWLMELGGWIGRNMEW